MKQYRLLSLLPFVIIVISFFLFLKPISGTSDFYHHLLSGKYVVQTHSLPDGDIYTHTAHGRPWIAYAWGSGVLYYGIYSLAGLPGIAILVATTGTLTLLLLYLLLTLHGISPKASLATLVLCAGMLLVRWPARPELVTYPAILALLLIERYLRKNIYAVFLIPVVIFIWANTYGASVLLGVGVACIVCLHAFQTIKHSKKLPVLILGGFATIIASLINGYGYRTLLYISFIRQVATYEGEWSGMYDIWTKSPPEYLAASQYFFAIYIAFVVCTIALFLASPKRGTNRLFLLLGLGIGIPIFAFRHTALAAILASPLLAHCLDTVTVRTRRIGIIVALTIGILSLLVLSWMNSPFQALASKSASTSLSEFLLRAHISGNVFNHQSIGAYISFFHDPQLKIFFDTRDDLYINTEAFADLYDVTMGQASILPLLSKYHIDVVVGDSNDGIDYGPVFADPGWALVYINDRYFVFVPTPVAQSANLPIYWAINPYSPTAARLGQEEDALMYYEAAIEDLPSSTNLTRATNAAIALGEWTKANEFIEAIQPGSGPIASFERQQKNLLRTKLELAQMHCKDAFELLSQTERDTRDVLFFRSPPPLPMELQDLAGRYTLLCQDDLNKTREILSK